MLLASLSGRMKESGEKDKALRMMMSEGRIPNSITASGEPVVQVVEYFSVIQTYPLHATV